MSFTMPDDAILPAKPATPNVDTEPSNTSFDSKSTVVGSAVSLASDLKGLSPTAHVEHETVPAPNSPKTSTALTQDHYFRTLVLHLNVDPKTRKLAWTCLRCDQLNARFGMNLRNRCGKLIHPPCRKTFISDQVTSAQQVFRAHPDVHMHFVTILAEPVAHLFEPSEAERYFAPSVSTDPTDAAIRSRVNRLIRSLRDRVDLAFRSVKPTLFIARGAFEFEVLERNALGKQKQRFLEDCLRTRSTPEWEACPDPVLLHLHALVVVKLRDRYLTGAEVSDTLGRFFPHRHQVVVDPLGTKYPRATAIMKRIAYPLKTHTDFEPHRAREVARALSIIGRNAILYRRTWSAHAAGLSGGTARPHRALQGPMPGTMRRRPSGPKNATRRPKKRTRS